MDMGHEAIILPAQFVAGSRQGQKTDANDALACAVAGNHPNARAVSIRTEEEQGLCRRAPYYLEQGTFAEQLGSSQQTEEGLREGRASLAALFTSG